VVGRWGGDRRVLALAADGDRVVLGAGANLVVGTVAADGTIVDGGTLALQNHPSSLAVSGDLAVVSQGGSRAWLVDIADPQRPWLAGRVPGLTGSAGVAISGNTVLVADYPVGLAVVDASDPAAPAVTRLPLPGAREVAFAGDLAVVVATEEHDDGSVTETLHVVDPSGMAPAASPASQRCAAAAASGGHHLCTADSRAPAGSSILLTTRRPHPRPALPARPTADLIGRWRGPRSGDCRSATVLHLRVNRTVLLRRRTGTGLGVRERTIRRSLGQPHEPSADGPRDPPDETRRRGRRRLETAVLLNALRSAQLVCGCWTSPR
jgi:hypothetical protein